ncbi:Bardet-Biedl syndrome 4 protein [Prorops nasuta]|uniref:Bardet-Biedl syndrome 4 protein n=1 Tax=Prorops nasuta TaxID=863751 RepID=UPI0034D01587
MANISLSNGRIQQNTVHNRVRIDRTKKAPDIPAVESLNWLLHKHYARHEYRICKTLIEGELAKSNGRNEYANYLKGLILRREGKIQDSLDCFQRAYDINSTNVDNMKQIAKSLLILGSHKRAVEAYLEADKICALPDWEIHYSLGECYTKLSQLQEAKKHFRLSTELTKNELPYLKLAKIYLGENKVTEAINVYGEALNGNPESVDAATELGLVYLRIGDTQRAFQQFGAALAQSPNYPNALLPMAFIMQNHREHDVALSKYKSAAHTIPESSAVWNNVGMCFYGKQKYVAAITCLKRAHYLSPLAMLPACNLGIVFLTTGQPASAAIYLSAAVTAEPKNPTPYLLLALALKKLNDLEGAERAITKAHALSPQDPLILINYAVILDAQDRNENVLEVLTALNDITAVIDVDAQIAETTKKLLIKYQKHMPAIPPPKPERREKDAEERVEDEENEEAEAKAKAEVEVEEEEEDEKEVLETNLSADEV